MLTSLKLKNFKNFQDASLSLGGLTVLVGTNSAGKSNIRDAVRFLHGVGRGYSLADIIGGKWGPGGAEWNEIRGGTKELAYFGTQGFQVHTTLILDGRRIEYEISSDLSRNEPQIQHESLRIDGGVAFDMMGGSGHIMQVVVVDPETHLKRQALLNYTSKQPILTQALKPLILMNSPVPLEATERPPVTLDASGSVAQFLNSIRFLDLSPDAMRAPSSPGQATLGDHGEYLASVLQAIAAQPDLNRTMLEWIKELTPLDVVRFEFKSDLKGKITLYLVESNGQETSAYSASDGTLRFLGILAALLGPTPGVYFIEELDTGIHPTRLHLLIELIEKQVAKNKIQVIATTHSPQMLGFLSEESLRHASLVYRIEGESGAHIARIIDLPDAERILKHQGLAELHATGWLEDAASFAPQASASAETSA